MTTDLQTVAAQYGSGTPRTSPACAASATASRAGPIWALKISDHPNQDEAEPEVLVECNMHAREHLTAEQCLYLVHLLTDNYSQPTALGKRVTNIVNTHEIFIIPMLNPDGAMFDISGGAFTRLAQEPPDQPGLDQASASISTATGATCGAAAAVRAASQRRRAIAASTRSRRSRTRSCATSSSVGAWAACSRSPRSSTSTATASTCSIRTATRKATTDAEMTARRSRTRSPPWPEDGLAQRLQGDAGQPACTSTTATSSTGPAATSTSSRSRGRCIRSWGCECGRFPSARFGHRARDAAATQDAALYLFEQADCPYRGRPDSPRKYCT